MARAQQIGEKIFGIQIPVLLEGDFNAYDLTQQAYIGTLGRYDFQNDIVRIYAKQIRSFCRKYNMDFESSFVHHVCHELGHAKEARLFEDSGIFPYRFNIISYCPIKLNSHHYLLNNVKIGGRGLYKVFMLGIQDYSIERELQKYGIKDRFSKLRVWNIQNLQKVVHLPEQKHRLTVEALSLLPLDICHYVYGELTQEEQLLIEKYYKSLIGDKWSSALRIMDDLQFGNAKKYVDVVCKLFEGILGLNIFLGENYRAELFKRYKHIPQFWNKRSYQVFYIVPLSK
jgi:hypothetical protein